MAINNTRRVSGNLGFTQKAHGQPDSFVAKGRGYFNTYPNFPATIQNANASLHNRATPDSNGEAHKLYLFVDYVSTGWQVSGETTQTHDSRTFYPRNLTQNDVEIKGTVANNYEYDKLVRFVEHHQNTVLQADDFEGNNFFRAVEFNLFKPNNANSFHLHKLKYRIAILGIEAGAERFKNAPTYTLRCKVLHDYLGEASEVSQAIERKVTYKDIFGQNIKKAQYTANSEESKAATAKVAANVQSNARLAKHKKT